MRVRRAELMLAGNSGEPPSMLEIFLGDQMLIGPEAKRIKTSLNKVTGKLDHRQLYHATDVVLPDGRKARQITLDERDKDQIPKILQRARKRQGLPPLSPEELATKAGEFKVTSVENPLIKVEIPIKFEYLRHAMMKIAYELAFLWLGESYLDDPLAADLRAAILSEDSSSTDSLMGYVGWASSCDVFKFWTPHKAHHLAFALVESETVFVAVRVFDIYAVAIPVSHQLSRYPEIGIDGSGAPFLAIDAATGNRIQTTFGDERRRIAQAMSTHGRIPPFPDPLPTDGTG
ncbi:hypothetical protein [Dyella sp. AD56]|uniref:hypothetical protein n=1 Tax=Dyella sp. AD56 TaxID=1528744 RepID=UPI001E605364|nr:hypothetical protein [Dyella sp. AD56]